MEAFRGTTTARRPASSIGVMEVAEIANIERFDAWNGYEGRHWADNADPVRRAGRGRLGIRYRPVRADAGDRSPEGEADGLVHVTLVRDDAQVYRFPAGRFDVAISRAAIRRPAGVRGDGATWLGTELGTVFRTAFGAYLPDGYAEANRPGPASLAHPARTTDVLTAAGFPDVRTTPLRVRLRLGADSVKAAEFVLAFGPVSFFLRQVSRDALAEVGRRLTAELARYETPGGVRLGATALLAHATRS